MRSGCLDPRLLLIAACLLAACAREAAPPVPGGMRARLLENPFAYIPAVCWGKPRDEAGRAVNSCYACHVPSDAPNFAEDGDLQLALSLPPDAATNPWRNLLAPPPAHPADTDAALLAYVRRSNYFDGDGGIALARALEPLPPAWDGEGDGRWDGYRPDVFFRFDERGFDHRPDGAPTGWRAYTSTPVVGFFPTNGAMTDTLVRLDAPYREDATGRPDLDVYAVNLAIAEALIKRADVAVDPVDERAWGVDLDRDGRLGPATRVAFDGRSDGSTGMRWVGRAGRAQAAGRAPIAVGLFPEGTELLHSLRYFDVGPDGRVAMAARMKELRYARKARFLGWRDLKMLADREEVERNESAAARTIVWKGDRGVANGAGWLLQGFIEAADGRLRPQSHEETAACAGCHGHVGATTDSTFSFARKLGADSPARGWFHVTQRDLSGVPEPKRRDGSWEYSLYLAQARAGDGLRANDEIRATFFDGDGRLRADRIAALHTDVAPLLYPSAARALALDRATRAIVRAQTFTGGREPVLGPAAHLYARAPIGAKTAAAVALVGP